MATDQEWLHLWHLAFRIAFRILHDIQAAEDIAQESIVALWQACSFPGRRAVICHVSWVSSAAKYLALRACYRNKRVICRPFSTPTPDDMADSHFSTLELLMGVPESDQLFLKLHYIQGYSVAEMSQMTNLPLGTVKWRLYRARKRLLNALNNR